MAPSETSSSKTLTFDRGHEIARAYSGERDQGMILSEFGMNLSEYLPAKPYGARVPAS
jgi:hypothetical protein